MKYFDGTTVMLGDLVEVSLPEGAAAARVVMLGETYDHLDIDPDFVDWVKNEKVLESSSVVIEWVGNNPFAHSDPQYAPVGNYMFTGLDDGLTPTPNKSLDAHASRGSA